MKRVTTMCGVADGGVLSIGYSCAEKVTRRLVELSCQRGCQLRGRNLLSGKSQATLGRWGRFSDHMRSLSNEEEESLARNQRECFRNDVAGVIRGCGG